MVDPVQFRLFPYIFLVFGTVAFTYKPLPEPKKEVVSIYLENFTTPGSRYPYFIEVYRCVDIEILKCHDKYPVPKTMTKIEVVVPDPTNNERDPSGTKKFYKYTIFNHTSCKCGRLAERKLYHVSFNNRVSEEYFLQKYKVNPMNLLNQCDYCNTTRERFKRLPGRFLKKYLPYEQCLPGCVVKEKKTKSVELETGSGETENFLLTSDTKCEAFDNRVIHSSR
ncbi:uncharacterized protein LOC114527811 [Dendronephthya gigantea]|uniref:uncharacterized protein LOC114527811 n=1 Tax=Dendronephthya gigantea TaxID=151771 RepID=UPI00106AE470|nr:uncharacterized protein LOC114527811 [Dendronephthya gigantea]